MFLSFDKLDSSLYCSITLYSKVLEFLLFITVCRKLFVYVGKFILDKMAKYRKLHENMNISGKMAVN